MVKGERKFIIIVAAGFFLGIYFIMEGAKAWTENANYFNAIINYFLGGIGYVALFYGVGNILYTYSCVRKIHNSKCPLEIKNWIENNREQKSLSIFRDKSRFCEKYYIYSPQYEIHDIEVKRSDFAKILNIHMVRGRESSEFELYQIKIVGDKSKKVIFNGNKYDVSKINVMKQNKIGIE